MQNNKLLDFTKDLNAQLYAHCGLTTAEVRGEGSELVDGVVLIE